jgi:hypothetical protein
MNLCINAVYFGFEVNIWIWNIWSNIYVYWMKFWSGQYHGVVLKQGFLLKQTQEVTIIDIVDIVWLKQVVLVIHLTRS